MSDKHRLMGTRANGGHDGIAGRGSERGARRGARRDAIGKTRRFNKLKSQTRRREQRDDMRRYGAIQIAERQTADI